MEGITEREVWKVLIQSVLQSPTILVALGALSGVLVKHLLTKSRNAELAQLTHQFASRLEEQRGALSRNLEAIKGEIKELGDLRTLKRSRLFNETANTLAGIYEKFVELDQLAGLIQYTPATGVEPEKLTKFKTIAGEAEYLCFKGRLFLGEDLFSKCKALSNEFQQLGDVAHGVQKKVGGVGMEGDLDSMKCTVKERIRPLFEEIIVKFRQIIEG